MQKYLRDTLGKFRARGRVGTGKTVRGTRGLGATRSQGSRTGSSLSSGGTIAGVDASKANRKASTASAETITSGTKAKR